MLIYIYVYMYVHIYICLYGLVIFIAVYQEIFYSLQIIVRKKTNLCPKFYQNLTSIMLNRMKQIGKEN